MVTGVEWLGKVIEALKLPLRYVWAIAIAAAILLFSPPLVLKRLRVEKFIQDFGAYIGIVFLVAAILTAIQLTLLAWKALNGRRRKKRYLEESLHALAHLDPKEKAVMREFYLQNQNTIQLPFDQATVAGLVAKGILYPVGMTGERSLAGTLRPTRIAEHVQKHLTHEMIELPRREPLSNEDIRFLRENRPKFLAEIEQHNELFHTSWPRMKIPY
jgi:hypothetical protein